MKIWIDADACPQAVRQIVLRANQKRNIPLVFVANSPLPITRSETVKFIQVEKGFDVADNYIVANVEITDLVITQDIPLAAEIVEKGITAINPRGQTYTEANIRQRLAMRNFMEELRNTGQATTSQNAFGDREKQAFANALDRWIAKQS